MPLQDIRRNPSGDGYNMAKVAAEPHLEILGKLAKILQAAQKSKGLRGLKRELKSRACLQWKAQWSTVGWLLDFEEH